MTDPSDYSTHESKVMIGRQLIEHGSCTHNTQGRTPLYYASCSRFATNLDFIQLLLENGANPNFQDSIGQVPLMSTTMFASSGAKFLLQWPATNMNIIMNSGASFLGNVRGAVKYVSDLPYTATRTEYQFLLNQWLEIEHKSVAREAIDTGILTYSSAVEYSTIYVDQFMP
jgi:hypothetical protein